MRYMYTTAPDKHCHEVEDGVFGRPVHSHEEPKLKKQGWSLNITSLRGADDVREEKESGQEKEVEVSSLDEAIDADAEAPDQYQADLAEQYKAKFGKAPHHKMKAETIRKKLEESDG